MINIKIGQVAFKLYIKFDIIKSSCKYVTPPRVHSAYHSTTSSFLGKVVYIHIKTGYNETI